MNSLNELIRSLGGQVKQQVLLPSENIEKHLDSYAAIKRKRYILIFRVALYSTISTGDCSPDGNYCVHRLKAVDIKKITVSESAHSTF